MIFLFLFINERYLFSLNASLFKKGLFLNQQFSEMSDTKSWSKLKLPQKDFHEDDLFKKLFQCQYWMMFGFCLL